MVWASTLFFAEGIPHVVLVTLAVVMYLQLGMSDTQIAFYTGWLCLPWVLRPLYRPFIELYQTRRWWVLAMQMLLGSALAGVAFTLNGSFWVQGTMFFFLLMAFSSATYGIAANDYCRLEMGDEDRSWYVGIRNTFYNIAIILGKGLLVPAAGILQVLFRNQKIYTWSLIFFGLAGIFIAFWLYHGLVLPRQTSAEKHSAKVIRNGMHDACFAFRHSYSVKELTVFLLFSFKRICTFPFSPMIGALVELEMLKLFRMSFTSPSVLILICPSSKVPLSSYVPASEMVMVFPSLVAPFPFMEMLSPET